MGAVFLRFNLGDMYPTKPARFRGSSLMGPLINSVVTHDFDYSQPLPPSAWTVSNPTDSISTASSLRHHISVSWRDGNLIVMWLLSHSVLTILSMNEVLCTLPYGDRDDLSYWKRVGVHSGENSCGRLHYTADRVEQQIVESSNGVKDAYTEKW